MQVHILGADNAAEWYRYLQELPKADIYFTPDYCKIYEENGEGQAQLFVYTEGNKFVYYPYIMRKVNGESIIQMNNTDIDLYDITTPYGYGGPLSNVIHQEERQELYRNFSEHFHEHCINNRIITEFVRFHPLLRNHNDYQQVAPTFVRNTVYIDLRLSNEEVWRNYSQGNRNRIRRAHKEGLVISHQDPHHLENFLELYYSTMEKKQANDYYYFNERFMANTLAYLQGNIELIEVKHGDKVIASCMFMVHGRYAHYHLMGSDRQNLNLCPVNLLIDYAASWAREKGCHYLHLGGGYLGEDNLYRFKRGFNTKDQLDFYIGRRIHCLDSYENIMRCLGSNHPEQSNEYFPAYRQLMFS